MRIEPYVEFAKKAFSREATYRMEVFTNVGSLIVRLYLMRAVWTALYAQNAAPAGIPQDHPALLGRFSRHVAQRLLPEH